MSISISGMFSGLDTEGIISQLSALNRRPIQELQSRQAQLGRQDNALNSVLGSFTNLSARLNDLRSTEVFRRMSVSNSDTSIGVATAASGAQSGTLQVQITQLATASTLTGAKASAVPAGSATLESVFGAAVAGTFSVNGQTVSLAGSMTLDQAASAIQTALQGGPGGTAVYNATTGKFQLNVNSGTLLLASGSSNFLQAAQLFNNNTASVTSVNGVGRLNPAATIAVSQPGAGSSGSLQINGVAINWSSSDSLTDVLRRINDSEAGVTATYDAYEDRVRLVSRNRGANAITVEDSGGALGSALGLTSGLATLAVGSETRYRVNGGAERTSVDATLDENELGFSGVSFTASKVGTTTLTIGADVDGVKSVIDAFVNQYNSLQNIIASYRKVDPQNPSANGELANDSSLAFVPSELRRIVGSPFDGNSTIRMLEDLGIKGNANDSTLTVADPQALREALERNPQEVIDLFTAPGNGLVARLSSLVEAYSEGAVNVIATRRESITQERKRMDREIELIEARVAAETAFLRASFAALESASSQASQFSSFFNLGRRTNQ